MKAKNLGDRKILDAREASDIFSDLLRSLFQRSSLSLFHRKLTRVFIKSSKRKKKEGKESERTNMQKHFFFLFQFGRT